MWEIHTVIYLFIMCNFLVSIFLFQVHITQPRSSHSCLIKFFGREISLVCSKELGACLFKTLKMLEKLEL